MLIGCLAMASAAQAGGFAGDACVAKKQAAAGKYAASVVKAWVGEPDDAAARNEKITKAVEKLDKAWTKEETKAAGKGSACNESTATSLQVETLIDGVITPIGADSTLSQLGDYAKDATKAQSKYFKDKTKDPGKVTLTAAMADASTENLAGASANVIAGATAVVDGIVEQTTTAPNYPTTFQTIQPNICAGGVCGGTDSACTTNAQCGTIVYQKKELQPICIDGDPYMYFARKGTTNNVLMYYQGGGACWSDTSCNHIPPNGAPTNSICSRTADANDNPALSTTGFANYNNPDNPFKDWNVVFITYCTCDVHWGENSASYGSQHYGRSNAAVVEKFAREHFVNPDRVFVTGSSAGSYGAIMNSYFLMRDVWPNSDFAVLGDAGVGVITKQWLDSYIDNWGVANNFPADLGLASDDPKDLSLVDLIDGLADHFTNARFANYDSSYDGGSGSQSNFFQVMRYPTPPDINIISNWGNYQESTCDWNACMRQFKGENASRATNYRYFTGAGSRHTIFGSDKVYTELKSTDALGNSQTFAEWVQAMIDDSPAWVNMDCANPDGAEGSDCNLSNTCQGGQNAGLTCTSSAECAPKTCVRGTNDGTVCVDDTACTGGGVCRGSCEFDPDSGTAPYANNDTVTCAPTTCPCGTANARCYGGVHAGASCDPSKPLGGKEDCKNVPGDVNEVGSCSYVNCAAP
ncbi:MAG TPA: pectin acetylesterase-family hydrolase [Candidatus Limnocylindrales bacterium]|nr:pectin acetylesterase-family hydrolase [Candidatus Limnocylindrales bacterium]